MLELPELVVLEDDDVPGELHAGGTTWPRPIRERRQPLPQTERPTKLISHVDEGWQGIANGLIYISASIVTTDWMVSRIQVVGDERLVWPLVRSDESKRLVQIFAAPASVPRQSLKCSGNHIDDP